jgi:hypothetical protein
MMSTRSILVVAFSILTALGQQATSQSSPTAKSDRPASCPLNQAPATTFVPPAPFSPVALPADVFLIGTEKLWTVAKESMVWEWSPHQLGHEMEPQPLTTKIFWYRVGYNPRTEPSPNLKVTGKRLEGHGGPLVVQYSNAIMGDVSAMLTGVYVPRPGCWEITGNYEGDTVSFHVWLKEAAPAQKSGQ